MTTETKGEPFTTEWLEGLKRGEGDAWHRLVEELTPALLKYANQFLRNHDDADDVVQDAWLSSRQAVVGSDKTVLYRAYFYTVVRCCAVRLGRKKRRLSISSLDHSPAGSPDGQPLNQTLADGTVQGCSLENRELVGQAMVGLDERERSVIECRFSQEMTRQETAYHVGLTINQIRYVEGCALAKMRCFIARELGDGSR